MRKEFVRKALGYVLAIVFILAGWELTALAVNNAALPGPFEAVPMVGLYFGDLWPAFLVSLYRVVVAMLIGTVLAIPLGLVCGRSPRVDAVFAPILYFLYPLPKVVLLSRPGSPHGPRRRPEDCAYRLDHLLPGLGYGARCGAKRARGKRRLHAVAWGREVRRVSPCYCSGHASGTLHGSAYLEWNRGRHLVFRGKPRRFHGTWVFHRRRMGVACVSEDVCRHYRHGVARGDFIRIVRYRRAPLDALAPREELSARHPRIFDSKKGSV